MNSSWSGGLRADASVSPHFPHVCVTRTAYGEPARKRSQSLAATSGPAPAAFLTSSQIRRHDVFTGHEDSPVRRENPGRDGSWASARGGRAVTVELASPDLPVSRYPVSRYPVTLIKNEMEVYLHVQSSVCRLTPRVGKRG